MVINKIDVGAALNQRNKGGNDVAKRGEVDVVLLERRGDDRSVVVGVFVFGAGFNRHAAVGLFSGKF